LHHRSFFNLAIVVFVQRKPDSFERLGVPRDGLRVDAFAVLQLRDASQQLLHLGCDPDEEAAVDPRAAHDFSPVSAVPACRFHSALASVFTPLLAKHARALYCVEKVRDTTAAKT
jgi:hypothetical protein